jgi:predicted sulfurtransferase
MGKIVLFYKYVEIECPQAVLKWQRKICDKLGLKGRVILATEGINATLGGEDLAIDEYVNHMEHHPLFGGIDFKYSQGGADHFPRMRIVVKDEIVHLGLDTKKITAQNGGIHLEPSQVNELIETKSKELVIIDCRNDYESAIGTFTNAIKPPTEHFREFPEYVDNNLDLIKDKEVLMFCTGGIRCERASTYVKEKGVAKNVYQIKGGIHRYAEQYPDGYFRGKNYVFDGRVAVKVNDDILGSCYLCKKPCDDYTNCLNAACNEHYIACTECLARYQNTCGSECQKLVFEDHVPQRPQRVTFYNAANDCPE